MSEAVVPVYLRSTSHSWFPTQVVDSLTQRSNPMPWLIITSAVVMSQNVTVRVITLIEPVLF